MARDPGEQWTINLVEGGYEHHCRSADDVRRIARLGQAWHRILRMCRIQPPASAFEIGCGGAEKMATLALNNFTVTGIDVSAVVIDRAKKFVQEIEGISNRHLLIEFIVDDFFNYTTEAKFDLVYHFGVVEHYLDVDARETFWKQAAALVQPGGWVVSVVPCGRHIMRCMMREQELLGYQHRLAEIDYSCASHIAELKVVTGPHRVVRT